MYRVRIIRRLYLSILLFGLLLASCNQSSPGTSATKISSVSPAKQEATPTVQSLTTSTPAVAPTHYTSHIVLKGVGRPDDLAIDQQGQLLFSDEFNNTNSRVNADGTASLVLKDANGPEGLVV